MTPIQKAKEIIEGYLGYMNSQLENFVVPATPEGWLVTDEAAALLSGEDWISVKDRLPEYWVDVLIYKAHHKRFVIGHRTSTSSVGEHWSCDYEHYVTHWMPLPEPPKP